MLTGAALVLAVLAAGVLVAGEVPAAWARQVTGRRLAGAGLPAVARLPSSLAVPRPAALVRRARAAVLPEGPLELVGFLDALARSLRTGASVRQALAEARPTAGARLAADLDVVLGELVRGAALATALAGWARRRPQPGVRLLVATLVLGQRGGGDLARAVASVAATERHRMAAVAEVGAQSAQARLSAVVVAVAPVGFTVVAAVAEPSIAAFLVGTPPGWACLAGGLVLDLAGAAWMARITRSVG